MYPSNQFVDTAAITAGGTFNTNNSYIRTFGRFNQDHTTYSLFPKMKNTVSESDYELVYDTANHVVVEGGKNIQLIFLLRIDRNVVIHFIHFFAP